MKNKTNTMKNKKQPSVYAVVYSEDYEGDRVHGIYSTKGKAEKALQAVIEEDGSSSFGSFWVKELKLDAAPQWDCLFEYSGVEA